MFNPEPATIMHIDLNSCFASIEQQANPLLRGKPVAVGAYTTPGGCILAASREAKALGIKTGMRVGDGQKIYPKLIVLPSDPQKYRFVNQKLVRLLSGYSDRLEVKSIDEMVLNFRDTPKLTKVLNNYAGDYTKAMIHIGCEIKNRIKAEIGEWLTVSIGIAPNRYLAKVASELHKPDGLDIINAESVRKTLAGLKLTDLCGIKEGYANRLRYHGINTAIEFYEATTGRLKTAFSSITGYYWRQRLHGFESSYDEIEKDIQKSFGQSYALYKTYSTDDPRLWQIICQLVDKMGKRLRADGYTARGLHLSCLYTDYTYWHKGQKLPDLIYANTDFYRCYLKMLHLAINKPVRLIAISCFNLEHDLYLQDSWLPEEVNKQNITKALDAISIRFGDLAVYPGRMLGMERRVLDRISFGKTN